MEGAGEPGDAEPDAETVVDHHAVDEEALEAAVHEVEDPLLGGVGAVVPDHTAREGRLLVEVLLAVPGAPLHLGHAESLSVGEAHVLGVAVFVVG